MYAIFYKEWIKTRWYFLLAVLATLGFTGYCMLRINRVVEMKGAAHVWEVMLQRDVIFIDMLQYIPLIAGILMPFVRPCLKRQTPSCRTLRAGMAATAMQKQ